MKIKFYSPPNLCWLFAKRLIEDGHEIVDHNYTGKVGATIIMSVSQTPMVVPEGDIYIYHWDLPEFRDLNNLDWFKYRDLCRRAKKIWSASRFSADEMKRLWGFDSEVLYHPIDFREFNFLKDLPIKKENYYIQASRNDKYKRFDLFQRACRESGVNYRCYYPDANTGNIMPTYTLENLTPQSGWGRRQFLAALKASKCLVSCSEFEGLGFTPIEAAYLKVPLILSDIPPFKEIWEGKALFFKKGDLVDLKYNILEVENGRTNDVEAAYQLVLNKFSYDNLKINL